MKTNNVSYIGYVSVLNGHILKDHITGLYELWDSFEKLGEGEDMEFMSNMIMYETEEYEPYFNQMAA